MCCACVCADGLAALDFLLEEYVVLTLKNRIATVFAHPHETDGYVDILINVPIEGHVTELQA